MRKTATRRRPIADELPTDIEQSIEEPTLEQRLASAEQLLTRMRGLLLHVMKRQLGEHEARALMEREGFA